MDTLIVDNLTCAICYDHLDDPKQLLCGHTFCLKCLARVFKQKSEDKLTCPLCRHVTSVHEGDVSRLTTNITLKILVSNFKTATKNWPQDNDPPAAAKASPFLQQTPNQDEKIREVKSSRAKKCDQHPDDPLAYYCKTCQKKICFKCRMLGCERDGHEIAEEAEDTKELQDINHQFTSENSDTHDIPSDCTKHDSIKCQPLDDVDEDTLRQNFSSKIKSSYWSKTADGSSCDVADPVTCLTSDHVLQTLLDDVGYDPGGARCKSTVR